MDGKKGVISIQLNWIFVLIIGAFILTFFILIVQKQKDYSEETIASEVQVDIQAILSSSQVSTGTASIVEVPNKDIEFSCEGFKVGNQFPAFYPYAFAPNLIKSDRNTISVYAYDWSVPFRVTNFLYVTSPDVRYVIDDSGGTLTQDLMDLLPPRYISKDGKQRLFMYKENGSITSLSDKNNYKVRLIRIFSGSGTTQTLTNNFDTKNEDLSALDIITQSCFPGDNLECYGDLKFYNYDGVDWSPPTTSSFIGKASILAAIFSENAKIYECGMNNSLKRLTNVAKIYQERSTNLDSLSCSNGVFGSASTEMDDLQNQKISDASSIFNTANNLKNFNEQLLGASCPTIY